MSKNILLISDDILKERTSVHGNIDPKLLYPEIKIAQDLYIEPLLGTALYDKILSDINVSGTTTGAYKTLLDDYIIDALLYYVLSGLPEAVSFQFYNKGVIRKQGDNTDLPSFEDLIAISDRYKRIADSYADRATRYLQQNASSTMLPEYLNPGNGVDSVAPSGNGYNMPIYLGDDDYDNIKSKYPGLRNYDL